MTSYLTAPDVQPVHIRVLHHRQVVPEDRIPLVPTTPLDLTYQEFVDLPAAPLPCSSKPPHRAPVTSPSALERRFA
jgi:hypothetical protein